MALALLDGTTAAFDFTTTVGSALSWKCHAGYFAADVNREFSEFTTFCGSGWRTRVPGMKQITGRVDGFMSTGDVISDPLALFASTVAVPFVATFQTGCTLTGSLHAGSLHSGLRAAGPSEMGLAWESAGSVASVWVTV